MMPTLTLTVIEPSNYPEEFRVYETTGDSIRIGREGGNDWVIRDDIRLVSREHCTIHFRSGVYVLIDTSANGVYLNGKSEPIGRGNSCVLCDGDRLRFPGLLLGVSLRDHMKARDPFKLVLPLQAKDDVFTLSAERGGPLGNSVDQPAAFWSGDHGLAGAPFAPARTMVPSTGELPLLWPQQRKILDEAVGGVWSSAETATCPESGNVKWRAACPVPSLDGLRLAELERYPPTLPCEAVIPERWDEEEAHKPERFSFGASIAAPEFGSPPPILETVKMVPIDHSSDDAPLPTQQFMSSDLADGELRAAEAFSEASEQASGAGCVCGHFASPASPPLPKEGASEAGAALAVVPDPTREAHLLLAMIAALSRLEQSVAWPEAPILLGGDAATLLDWLRTLEPVIAGQAIADVCERILAVLPAETHHAIQLSDAPAQ